MGGLVDERVDIFIFMDKIIIKRRLIEENNLNFFDICNSVSRFCHRYGRNNK